MKTRRGAVSVVARAAFAVFAAFTFGCSRDTPAPAGTGGAATGASALVATLAPDKPGAPAPGVALDVLAEGGDCTFGHQGVLLDLGDVTTRARLAPAERSGRVDSVERDGASWARVFARAVTIPFLATDADVASGTADGATPVIEARVRGGSAKSVAVYLNGKAVGVWPLVKGEARIASASLAPRADATGALAASSPQLVAGTNELLLRFRGAARAGASAPDEEAEIDWVHVGGAVAGEAYAAPTRSDAVTSVTLGGVPLRAVSLRAPGYARCLGWLPQSGRLVTSVGALGAGDAEVELRVTRDRAPPVVLASVHVTGDAPWRALDFPLDARAARAPATATRSSGAAQGTLGAIELVAVRGAKGMRVAFGEPRVVVPAEAAPVAPVASPAKPVTGVVLVVLGSEAPRALDLYAAPGAGGGAAQATPVPELDALAKAGLTFDANRAASGSASAAFASILTALPPRASGVIDDESGLAPDVTTLADVARQAGIRAAMFTANPSTGSAFGFARGWDTFVEHPPDLSEAPGSGTAPFDDAARWIGEHSADGARFLVVVHARGGHPPWDATPESMRTLAPPDYTGGIDPHRAAELLVRTRAPIPGMPRIAPLHLTDSDRTRAWALYALAIREHDAALGRLMAALKAAGRDDATLVIVSGDVGLGEARAPLESNDLLDESALASPLVVRFPGATTGARVAAPTTSVDVARTVVDAFGLAPPAAFQGEDLARVAAGAESDPRGRPELAVLGAHFALRWGTFILRGVAPSEDTGLDVSKLCDVSLEPACTSDVRGAFPLALSALRREVVAQAGVARVATPVVETPGVRVSLRLWGL